MEILYIKLEHHLDNIDKAEDEKTKDYHTIMATSCVRVLKTYEAQA